jgi:hypothetical protein
MKGPREFFRKLTEEEVEVTFQVDWFAGDYLIDYLERIEKLLKVLDYAGDDGGYGWMPSC